MTIDAHIHVVPPNLPGVGPLHTLLRAPETLAGALRQQMDAAGVTTALAMGAINGSDDDPLGVASTLRIAHDVPGLHAIGVIHPQRHEPGHLQRVERELVAGRVKAFKAYLGYLHFGPEHAGYVPYYELAQKYRVPVIFHTGDTYSPQAKLKYAHPLAVDEVAVDFPDVRFVLAHCGNPWLLDAAEVIYKNVNVWADLSGLVLGEAKVFTAEEHQDELNDLRVGLRQAFRYAQRPNRFVYGSDWPLAPMPDYRAFVASAIPPAYHEAIFVDNARLLFRLPG